jgi:tetratricopeptide (TPR) repeat protein
MGLDCCRFGKVLPSARVFVALALVAQFLFVFVGNAVRAQSPNALAELNRWIPELAAKGEMKKATARAKRYVDLARKGAGKDSPEYATAITWLGWLYQSEQRYEDAEPLLKRALVIRETAFGPDHALVATSLYNLAGFIRNRADGPTPRL